jgi:hypothetical protein
MKIICVHVLVSFLYVFIGCVSLSQQTKEQNIKIVTSPLMVEGMQNVYAYTIQDDMWSFDAIGIRAANAAAKGGWSEITILVKYIGSAGGAIVYNTFIPINIYEISFWKE